MGWIEGRAAQKHMMHSVIYCNYDHFWGKRRLTQTVVSYASVPKQVHNVVFLHFLCSPLSSLQVYSLIEGRDRIGNIHFILDIPQIWPFTAFKLSLLLGKSRLLPSLFSSFCLCLVAPWLTLIFAFSVDAFSRCPSPLEHELSRETCLSRTLFKGCGKRQNAWFDSFCVGPADNSIWLFIDFQWNHTGIKYLVTIHNYIV